MYIIYREINTQKLLQLFIVLDWGFLPFFLLPHVECSYPLLGENVVHPQV